MLEFADAGHDKISLFAFDVPLAPWKVHQPPSWLTELDPRVAKAADTARGLPPEGSWHVIADKFVDLYARNSGLRDNRIAARDVVLTYALRALTDDGAMTPSATTPMPRQRLPRGRPDRASAEASRGPCTR